MGQPPNPLASPAVAGLQLTLLPLSADTGFPLLLGILLSATANTLTENLHGDFDAGTLWACYVLSKVA